MSIHCGQPQRHAHLTEPRTRLRLLAPLPCGYDTDSVAAAVTAALGREQTKVLLRRWLPKGTDLNIGAVRLAVIEDWINTMPRKLLDWYSAHTALSCTHC